MTHGLVCFIKAVALQLKASKVLQTMILIEVNLPEVIPRENYDLCIYRLLLKVSTELANKLKYLKYTQIMTYLYRNL